VALLLNFLRNLIVFVKHSLKKGLLKLIFNLISFALSHHGMWILKRKHMTFDKHAKKSQWNIFSKR
jgi:hypothetical protein